MNISQIKICVVGLGYVGLPLAVAFAKTKQVSVFGYDHGERKIKQLQSGIDPTNEVGNQTIAAAEITYSADPAVISQANFIIVAVPTPVDANNKPDLSLVQDASATVGKYLRPGSVVVYESTVYPGVTEEICLPILEKESGLKAGSDFKIGYSPERINPGDHQHSVDKVIKVVSGQDHDSLELIASVYSLVCAAGVHKASSIKVAEAAKVIENIQRDLNIALMNELSLIFDKMNIDTREVIKAAATKWNFHVYYPGLVGGHCIGVDPYYLTFRAQQIGYEPHVILAGRAINDAMATTIAKRVLSHISDPARSKILVLGLTFKENVNDFRNSKSKDVIKILQQAGATVYANDPLATDGEIKQRFGIDNTDIESVSDLDAIVYIVPHQQYQSLSLEALRQKAKVGAVLFDLRGVYDRSQAAAAGFNYLTL